MYFCREAPYTQVIKPMQKLFIPVFALLFVLGLDAQAQHEKESVAKYRVSTGFVMPTAATSHASDSDSTQHVRPHVTAPVSPADYGVSLQADSALYKLIALDAKKNLDREKAPGFRIQIYAGSGLESANDAKTDFLIAFDDEKIPVYQMWNPPHFRVRVGDFLSHGAAMREIANIRTIFPDAFIVADKVKLPKFKESSLKNRSEEPETLNPTPGGN